MAPPQASDIPAVQAHYATQTAISTSLVEALRKLWHLVDRRNLAESLDTYSTAAYAVVQHFAQASVLASRQNFTTMQRAAGIPALRPTSSPIPTRFQVRLTVGLATQDLWDSPGQTITTDDSKVQLAVEGNVQKLVADAGRNQMIEAIEADRYARGFARVTKPGACAFCRLLATRGAVYKTAQSAGAVGVTLLNPAGLADVNRYHPNCHCTVVPLFADHYEPAAHVRADEQLYEDSTKDVHGSKAKRKAWRRAVEGRSDGPEHKSGPIPQKPPRPVRGK